MKLLLVDDDPDLLGVTGFALQQAGFLVVTATTAPAAGETFRRERPDVPLHSRSFFYKIIAENIQYSGIFFEKIKISPMERRDV